MPPPPPAPPPAHAHCTRDTMLDAAEDVVLRDGIGGFSLDAVARQAGLSKSGLLHHFPTKDALVDALVRRKLEGWRCEHEAAIARERPGKGRVLRAMLGTCLSSTEAWDEEQRRRGMVLIAALVHDERHMSVLREVHGHISGLLRQDGLPPGVADAVQMMTDGLWFDWIFGLTELTPQRLASVRAAILRLAGDGAAKSKATRPKAAEPIAAKPRARRAAAAATGATGRRGSAGAGSGRAAVRTKGVNR